MTPNQSHSQIRETGYYNQNSNISWVLYNTIFLTITLITIYAIIAYWFYNIIHKRITDDHTNQTTKYKTQRNTLKKLAHDQNLTTELQTIAIETYIHYLDNLQEKTNNMSNKLSELNDSYKTRKRELLPTIDDTHNDYEDLVVSEMHDRIAEMDEITKDKLIKLFKLIGQIKFKENADMNKRVNSNKNN